MNELVKLGITDLEEIDAFHRLCFQADYFTREAWEELLPDPRTLVYAIREGERLLNRMMEDMQGQGMGLFKAETRVSNLPMQRLFSKMGFERTQRAEKLMERPVEDGFKYQYRALNIS